MPQSCSRDPRDRLVREKYFSIRPKPLERWLWTQRVPPAAERVFWLHWQEGMQRGDWCSEVPLSRVARECCLDLSTVTKAYQLLKRLGCIRRTDPGRDPANPFQQAVAVTEVRIPLALLGELGRHPSRRTESAEKSQECVQEAAKGPRCAALTTAKSEDPFAGLKGRERIRALGRLMQVMSAPERARYEVAMRARAPQVTFDADSKLTPEDKGRVLQLLMIVAADSERPESRGTRIVASAVNAPRKLSVFELARLKRDVQSAVGSASAPELLRQVLWSIEEGSLGRFTLPHAINIALKKIREGGWTRPNRIPPNWTRAISVSAQLETCRQA